MRQLQHLQQLTAEQLDKRLQDLLKLSEFDSSDDNIQHEICMIVDMLESEG